MAFSRFKRRRTYSRKPRPGMKRMYRRRAGSARRVPRKGKGTYSRRQLNTLRAAAAITRSGGALGIEQKWYDTSMNRVPVVVAAVSGTDQMSLDATHRFGPDRSVASVAAHGSLCAPPAGSSYFHRDGRTVTARSLSLNFTIQLPRFEASYAAIPNYHWQNPTVSLYVILDTQANADVFNPGDVLFGGLAGNPNTDQATHLFVNQLHARRFRILWSQHVQFNRDGDVLVDGGSYSAPAMLKHVTCYIPLNLKINYKDAQEGVGSVIDNNISVIAVTDFSPPTPSDFGPKLSYQARFRFVG